MLFCYHILNEVWTKSSRMSINTHFKSKLGKFTLMIRHNKFTKYNTQTSHSTLVAPFLAIHVLYPTSPWSRRHQAAAAFCEVGVSHIYVTESMPQFTFIP